MPLSRRYLPEHPADEQCNFGADFSFILPFGVGIDEGSLAIFTNVADPAPADSDWTKGDVTIRGRAVYAMLSGGVPGVDYQLRWTVVDNQGNSFTRTFLVLCSETS